MYYASNFPGVLLAPLTPDYTTIPRVAFTKSLVLSYSYPTGDGKQTVREETTPRCL